MSMSGLAPGAARAALMEMRRASSGVGLEGDSVSERFEHLDEPSGVAFGGRGAGSSRRPRFPREPTPRARGAINGKL